MKRIQFCKTTEILYYMSADITYAYTEYQIVTSLRKCFVFSENNGTDQSAQMDRLISDCAIRFK